MNKMNIMTTLPNQPEHSLLNPVNTQLRTTPEEVEKWRKQIQDDSSPTNLERLVKLLPIDCLFLLEPKADGNPKLNSATWVHLINRCFELISKPRLGKADPYPDIRNLLLFSVQSQTPLFNEDILDAIINGIASIHSEWIPSLANLSTSSTTYKLAKRLVTYPTTTPKQILQIFDIIPAIAEGNKHIIKDPQFMNWINNNTLSLLGITHKEFWALPDDWIYETLTSAYAPPSNIMVRS